MQPLIQKWIEALESGDYEQGVGGLWIENRFCCLGVLCDISREGIWDATGPMRKYIIKNNESASSIPVHSIAGTDLSKQGLDIPRHLLSDEELHRFTYADTYDLVYLNDEGISFKRIAELIRNYCLDQA